jgi:restriction endonuclease S subunit
MNEPYKLPDGWKWVKLGEVCEYNSGIWGDEPDNSNNCYFILRSNNIKDGKMIYEEIAIRKVNSKYVEEKSLKLGDILVTTSSGSKDLLGKSAIFIPPDDKTYLFSNFTMRLRSIPSIVNYFYLYFYLQSPQAKKVLQLIQDTTTGLRNLDRKEFLNQYIPLPPLSEQKHIVENIKTLMDDIEHAKNACEKQIEAAEALFSAYLHQIFESEEAKKWERKKLGEIIAIIESGSRPKGVVFEIKEGIPSIGAEHLNSFGGFNFNTIRFIPNEFYRTMSKGQIQKRDVLVVKDGATTGKTSFVGDDFPYEHAAINEHVFRLRAKENLEQEFLFWFLFSPLGQNQIKQEFHGSAQGGINKQFVKGVYIPIPPLSIQRRIITELKEKFAYVENLKSKINDLKATIDHFLNQF